MSVRTFLHQLFRRTNPEPQFQRTANEIDALWRDIERETTREIVAQALKAGSRAARGALERAIVGELAAKGVSVTRINGVVQKVNRVIDAELRAEIDSDIAQELGRIEGTEE